ncbi:hypothetical protein [Candidatus Vondammii sp. HM_W22]|uniref:hypothetical protein n=1 Tax=Candidatus Vondammii sp. HM_W22 TaxID=2687299 RepID=UPI001F141F4E|nr:hypothetical protein [Candidatus Vondammii sp. HM_W22]
MIFWGETRCSVNLRFRAEADAHYEIARFLDRDGNHGVRLNLIGEEDQPITCGIVQSITHFVTGGCGELR